MRGKLVLGAATAALLSASGLAFAQGADQPGDSSTTARLNPGQAVSDTLSPAGDKDWFRLSVEPGQRYRITLESGAPGVEGDVLGDPMLVIYSVDNSELARNDDNGENLNSAVDYIPTEAGEVLVEARGFGDEASGAYTLLAQASVLPPDNAGNDSSTSARLTPGQAASGALEYPGDVDWFRLSVRPGMMYRIALDGAGDEALSDPLLILYNADGEEIARNDDSEAGLNSLLEYAATERADVFVEARAFGDGASGGYTVNAEATRLPPDREAAATNTRARIAPGQSVDGSLDYPADKDWFRVTLEEGQSYRFTLSSGEGETGLADPLLRLFNDDGEELASDDDSGDGLNSYLEFVAPSSGAYFVEASSFGDASGGAYVLTAAAGDIPADATTDASLSADGDYREGRLAPAGDSDWFRLEMSEGQSVRIGLDSPQSDGVGDPLLVVHGPDGGELASDDDGGEGLNSWLEFTAPSDGAYYVEARGFSEEAEGVYAVNITPGEIPGAIEGAELLNPNAEPRYSQIGASGDADWFVVELIEGRPYRFNLEGVGEAPLADPLLTLYDSQGTQIATDDDGGTGVNSYLTFVSPTGGPYFAAVTSYDATSTGGYMLRVADTDVPGHIATDEFLNAEAGDDRLSSIDFANDLDFYRVELTSGVRYEINVSGEGDNPLADPFVTVVSSSGEAITTDDDGGEGLDARLRFTPSATDVYYIQASGLAGSLGGYRVSIARQE